MWVKDGQWVPGLASTVLSIWRDMHQGANSKDLHSMALNERESMWRVAQDRQGWGSFVCAPSITDGTGRIQQLGSSRHWAVRLVSLLFHPASNSLQAACTQQRGSLQFLALITEMLQRKVRFIACLCRFIWSFIPCIMPDVSSTPHTTQKTVLCPRNVHFKKENTNNAKEM